MDSAAAEPQDGKRICRRRQRNAHCRGNAGMRSDAGAPAVAGSARKHTSSATSRWHASREAVTVLHEKERPSARQAATTRAAAHTGLPKRFPSGMDCSYACATLQVNAPVFYPMLIHLSNHRFKRGVLVRVCSCAPQNSKSTHNSSCTATQAGMLILGPGGHRHPRL